jgi:L-asparaginase
MREIELITTGGTIEKTYDEVSQELRNAISIVDRMLRRLKLPESHVHVRTLFSKDSRELSAEDRAKIVRAVRAASDMTSSIVVLHGTDTLAETGDLLAAEIGTSGPRVVLTGAMRPFEMKRSDALQNLTEALLASTLLVPGVYCVMHGKCLSFPGARKDPVLGTFVNDAGDARG